MDISWHLLTNVQHTYGREEKLMEKYDVSTTRTEGGDGEYPLQDDLDQTSGVTLKMLGLICPKEQPCDNIPAMRPPSESTTQPLKQKEAEPTPQLYYISSNATTCIKLALFFLRHEIPNTALSMVYTFTFFYQRRF